MLRFLTLCALVAAFPRAAAWPAEIRPIEVEFQPLAANVGRLLEALKYLGAPLNDQATQAISRAIVEQNADELQRAIDSHVLLMLSIDAESRVTVTRGPAEPRLQQAGFVPLLVKVVNRPETTKRLTIDSPQAGPVYAGVAELSMKRQQQEHLRANEKTAGAPDRFLHLEMFDSPPMKDRLSGLAVEYAIALVYASEAGKREATIVFDLVDERRPELNKADRLRGEARIAFDVRPAIAVRLSVKDADGQPTVARLLFRDALGHVYPPQPKRLAPDLFFQPHIYRADGETVLLPPGKFRVQSSRGPEYRVVEREVTITGGKDASLDVALDRWIDPARYGFYSGDHHIHAAGCAHYSSPTEGVGPADMFRQVKGEGLNVGCVLTWGPCFEYQRRFFTPAAHEVSDARTVLKYDLEISGFGSQALGHVCLLGLKDQLYPGTDGTTKGWPTWTTPVMRWAKQQGGIAGYAHSASGLQIDPAAAAKRLLTKTDADENGTLSKSEASAALLPESFEKIDADSDRALSERELRLSHDRVADELPNLAIPEMNGVGAMEIAVSAAEGVCDFISAMDTPRIQEWNTWYHLLNCGFPIKVSGETDFPCMASRSVGQGRVYVQLGKVDRVDFAAWCKGLAAGRSYVSDGYAHAVEFAVNDRSPGDDNVRLERAGDVTVQAKVAFAEETPLAVAYGGIVPPTGRRVVGDTVLLHGPRSEQIMKGGLRLVEIVINGQRVASREVPADGKIHELEFTIPVERSSWVALRHFPQLHTNPVNVIVADQPIRASRDSARWCIEMIELLWKNRRNAIAAAERDEARKTFDRAIQRYREIAHEAADDSRPRITAHEVLSGLRRFYEKTARPDGSFQPGIDPEYVGMSDCAYSDLAAVTYACTIHKTFGWRLPHEKMTVEFLLSRQKETGEFVNVAGTVDPASPQGKVYNTTQALVALRALGVRPRHDPLAIFEEILKQDYKTLPAYSTSFFPLAYLCYGKPISEQADRAIRALMIQDEDGYLNDHIAATFHASHYYALVGDPTPKAEQMIARVLRDQKPDGSWLLNQPARDRHATFDAVFTLLHEGHGRTDCRAAIERAAQWALSCRNDDGGFGHLPGSTSDADAVYFQVGTLVMAGFLKPADPPPDDPHLLSWGHLMPVRQRPRSEEQTIIPHPGWVGGVVLAANGKVLATASSDNVARLWESKSGKLLGTFVGHTDCVSSVALSPDGKTLATGSYDRTANLLNVSSQQARYSLEGHRGAVTSVAFSPDGVLLSTGSVDGQVILWDVKTGERRQTLTGHKSWVNSVAFNPDGELLISGSSDGTVKIWSAETGEHQKTIPASKAEVRSVAYSPDGKWIAAGIRYGAVKVWHANNRAERHSWQFTGDDVSGITFSPDSRRLLVGTGEWNRPGRVEILDLASGKAVDKLAHAGEVLSVAVSRDGSTIAAGGGDRAASVWRKAMSKSR